MTNDYASLDDFGTPKFHVPPMLCGEYELTSPHRETYEYTVRYMPRRAKHAGRFGLFYYDPDAHDQLIGVWYADTKNWKCVEPVYMVKFDFFFSPIGSLTKKLVKAKCAWCGKELHDRSHFTHQTATCNKFPKESILHDSEPEPEPMKEEPVSVKEQVASEATVPATAPAITLPEVYTPARTGTEPGPEPAPAQVKPPRVRKDAALIEEAKAGKLQIVKLSINGKHAGKSSADIESVVGPTTAAKLWEIVALLMNEEKRKE